MTLNSLIPELKDASMIEIQPGKRYVVFVAAGTVSTDAIEHIAGDATFGADIMIVPVMPDYGQSVADAVAAFAIGGKEKAE